MTDDGAPKLTIKDHIVNATVSIATAAVIINGYNFLKSKLIKPDKEDKDQYIDGMITPLLFGAVSASGDKASKHYHQIAVPAIISVGYIAAVELFRAIFPRKKEKAQEPLAMPSIAPAHHGGVDSSDTNQQPCGQVCAV